MNPNIFIATRLLLLCVVVGLAQLLSRWSGQQDQVPGRAAPPHAGLARRALLYGPTATLRHRLGNVARPALVLHHLRHAVHGGPAPVSGWPGRRTWRRCWPSPAPEGRGAPGISTTWASCSLAFVMFWAYFAFSQFLIIWSGNLPEEITWYPAAGAAGGRWWGWRLSLFHFVLPSCCCSRAT